MLKYGLQQDNVFDIIEKGNFFSPTKGEEPSAVYVEHSPRKAKVLRILKWGAAIVGVICFIILGIVVLGSEFG